MNEDEKLAIGGCLIPTIILFLVIFGVMAFGVFKTFGG